MRRKPKKPPPVTPRSFRRFFTPRSMLNGGNGAGTVRTNRQALKVLSSPAVNRLGPAFTRALKAVGNVTVHNNSSDLMRTPSRKRKLSFSSVGSPLQSSPLRKVRVRFPVENGEELGLPVKDIKAGNDARDLETKPVMPSKLSLPIAPIRRSHSLQTSGGLYMRSILGPRANRVTMRSNAGAGLSSLHTGSSYLISHYVSGWQDMTSAFYSRSTDSHSCASYTGDRLALPFCTATCNSM
jgi:hypothetical protein